MAEPSNHVMVLRVLAIPPPLSKERDVNAARGNQQELRVMLGA